MADVYGRAGVQVGDKGGRGLSSAYEFGAKRAEEYLTSGMAEEYQKAASTLRTDLHSSGYHSSIPGQARAKMAAKDKVGKLRDIAQASAVGEFIDFSGSMGRGSQAKASEGLITGETYMPETKEGFEKAANVNYWAAHSDYGKAMAHTFGHGAAGLKSAINKLSKGATFAGSGPVSYGEATEGKTGELHRKFKDEESFVSGMGRLPDTQLFSETARSMVPEPKYGRRTNSQRVRQWRQEKYEGAVEDKRQSILSMTPAERYLQGITT